VTAPNPLDFACPHQNPDLTNCGAGAGESCNWQEPNPGTLYHAERLEAATAEGTQDIPDDIIDAAALDELD
jgi:hypothetical protein